MNNSCNIERLKAEISRDIKEIIQFDLRDETIGFLTITDVVVSSDHSYATVYVSFFNNQDKNIEKLMKASGFIRSRLSKRLKTRRVPEIRFMLDDTYFKVESLDKTLKEEKEILEKLKK